MNRVAILLVNWNGWRDTIECLESLLRLESVDYRVVVCDNASSDGSLEQIKEWAAGALPAPPTPLSLASLTTPPVPKPIAWAEYDRHQAETGGDPALDPPLVLIRTGDNRGFAGGNNVGLRYLMARGACSHIWLLNNDTVVAQDSLKELLAQADADPRVGICGSTLLYYDAPEKIQARGGGYYCRWIGLPWLFGRWRRYHADAGEGGRVPWLMNYVVGASMLVSRQFLDEVGLMTEDYFLFFEETDWAWRGRDRFRLGWAPASRVYHKVGSTIGTSTDPRRKSPTCDYYALRNRLLFTRRFAPLALPTIYLSLLAAAAVRLLCGRRDQARLALQFLLGRDPGGPGGRP